MPRLLPLLILSLIVLVTACEPRDYPSFQAVDAWCEDDLEYFELWADVSHERGPLAVAAVYVRPAWVEYDAEDNVILTDLGVEFDLEYQAEGQWALAILSGQTPLACDYPYEYYFLFTAEDEDGDSARTDLIN
jgi:hypothetical protein